MNTKVECIICLGSNYNATANIAEAVTKLNLLFPDITYGIPIVTPAEGVLEAPDYTNQAARFTTSLTPDELKKHFKSIEYQCGRTPHSKSTGIIPLDIDLLTYDKHILKPQDLKTRYVQQSLASLQ